MAFVSHVNRGARFAQGVITEKMVSDWAPWMAVWYLMHHRRTTKEEKS